MLIFLTILFYLFITIGLFHMVHFMLYLMGANIYDIWALRTKRLLAKQPPYKPLVTVVIPAFNEEKVIERCLQSVWNNTYDKIEIIVVNDGSKDKTAAAIQRYITKRTRVYKDANPKITRTKYGLKRLWTRGNTPMYRRIKLVSKSNGGKASALNVGMRRHTSGELVMTLDADSFLHKAAIANAVKYFKNPKVVGLAANVRIIEDYSVLGLLQRFEHMIGYRSKKLFTLTNCELIIGGVASTYRSSILKSVKYYDMNTVTEDIGLSMKIAARGNRKNRLLYAADVVAMTEGVEDFNGLLTQRYRWKLGNLQNLVKYRRLLFSTNKRYSRSLTFYRVPMAFFGEFLLLLEPIALAYVTYLSIRFFTPVLFISAYITITAYILLNIWPDEHLGFWGKLKSSAFTPLLYFIFYIMNIIQLLSIIRCIINRTEINHLTKSHKNWISPRRLGRAATVS